MLGPNVNDIVLKKDQEGVMYVCVECVYVCVFDVDLHTSRILISTRQEEYIRVQPMTGPFSSRLISLVITPDRRRSVGHRPCARWSVRVSTVKRVGPETSG